MNKPVILFESFPDFSGSALEIYNELVKRGYDKKYDLIWAVYSDFNQNTNYKIIKFFNCNSVEKQDIIRRTKCIIDSNRCIPKFSQTCYRIHVRHGCAFKNCSNVYYKRVGNLDAIITTSKEMKIIDQKYWAPYIKDKFIITGLPATDRLFNKIDLYENGFIKKLTNSDNKFNKIIGWLPTFRQHRFGGPLVGKKFKYGLPTVNDMSDVNKLNDVLKQQNILLMIQMHHGQKRNYTALQNFSNIVFITEELKQKYNLTTHSLMSNFDALITDYSAAYHEYIILNKPIGLTIDDLVEYNKLEGFCYNYLDWIKGEYLLDIEDIEKFIIRIANNQDEAKIEREKSLHKIHDFIDNKSTERVVNYLIKHSGI